MLWQWVIQRPGLSVSKSTSTVCMGGTSTVSCARPARVAQHLGCVPVQMYRVEHHGLVDVSQANPLTRCYRHAVDRGIVELAVDRPGVAIHRGRQSRSRTSSVHAGAASPLVWRPGTRYPPPASPQCGDESLDLHPARGPVHPHIQLGVAPLALGHGDHRDRRVDGDCRVNPLSHAEDDRVGLPVPRGSRRYGSR